MKKFELTFMAAAVPVDAILLFFAGLAAYALRFTETAVGIRRVMFYLPLDQFIKILILVVPVWIIIFATNGLYTIDPNRKFASEASRVFFACTVGLAAITVYIFFRGEYFNSRFIVLAAWGFAVVFVLLGRIIMRLAKLIFYQSGVGLRRTVLIGGGPIAERIKNLAAERRALGYAVVAHYSVFNEKIREEIMALDAKNDIDELLLANPKASGEETIGLLSFAEEHHFTLKYSADLFSTLAPNMRVSTVGDIPIIEFRRARLDGWGKIWKRAFDLTAGTILIILSSPFLAAAALAIFLETGRPLVFENTRVGFRGKKFRTLKFRSMFQKFCTENNSGENSEALKLEAELIAKQNSKNGSEPVYKIGHDPRVTRAGKWLRRWSVDELPQLFNVLRGNMSLVGPRPHQPREVARYTPEHRRVHAVKPGITGLAQISGRSDLSFDEEVRLDMFYVENWSMVMDLFILLKTPWAVIKRRMVE